MALRIFDRVKQVTSSTGTGNITLGGTPNGFQSFSDVFSSGDTTYICIENGANWEVSRATYGVAGSGTLSRDTILDSSTGAAINLSGRSTVFCTVPAAKYAYLDPSGEINLSLGVLDLVGQVQLMLDLVVLLVVLAGKVRLSTVQLTIVHMEAREGIVVDLARLVPEALLQQEMVKLIQMVATEVQNQEILVVVEEFLALVLLADLEVLRQMAALDLHLEVAVEVEQNYIVEEMEQMEE